MKRWTRTGASALVIGAMIATAMSSVAGSTPPSYEQTGLISLEISGSESGTAVLNGATTQTLGTGQGCAYTSTGPEVLAISGSDLGPGIANGSIGVQAKRNGRNCGQIDGAERLTIALGGAAPSDEAVFRAELDLELQQDAVVVATTYLEGAQVGAYTLFTGENIPAGVVPSNPVSATDASPNVACNPQSSSGPNSSASDNCRFVLEPTVVFDTLVLTTSAGKASLEGGADGTAVATGGQGPGSLFFLAEAPDGILDCGDVVSVSDGSLGGVVTRLDNAGGTPCDLKPYTFDINGNQVEFEPTGFTGARYSAGITKPVPVSNPLTVSIEYDRDGDDTIWGFTLMKWCENAVIQNSVSGGDVSRLVTDADLPAGESWCIAAVDVLEAAGPDAGSAVFWLYGEDDPHWR